MLSNLSGSLEVQTCKKAQDLGNKLVFSVGLMQPRERALHVYLWESQDFQDVISIRSGLNIYVINWFATMCIVVKAEEKQ